MNNRRRWEALMRYIDIYPEFTKEDILTEIEHIKRGNNRTCGICGKWVSHQEKDCPERINL
jgi:hypothetical protein